MNLLPIRTISIIFSILPSHHDGATAHEFPRDYLDVTRYKRCLGLVLGCRRVLPARRRSSDRFDVEATPLIVSLETRLERREVEWLLRI